MNATPARQAQKIKVVVVEDQPPVLKNQLKILQDAPEIEVVGTALSGEAALTLLEKQQPDVVLQDLGLPRMSGIEVTREVKAGGSVIQPNLARRLLRHFRVPEDANAPPQPEPLPPGIREEPPIRPLTVREIEILRLIAKGLSNNEAARVLTLSRATVRTHLEHIYEKLEVTNRVEAVTEGLRKGLIEM